MITTIRKHSKKREAILRTIRSTTFHPSAHWVYEKLKPSIPSLSLGTVYRNINLFRQEGSVISIGVVDGEERFDGFVIPHPHLICICCGKVFDLPCSDLPNLNAIIMKSPEKGLEGFEIDYQRAVFYGVCAGCAEK
jgi:Fur family peroxide stress response transcriptional regulator